jgi:ribosomal protein S18 acetylase RimI-like enzyme
VSERTAGPRTGDDTAVLVRAAHPEEHDLIGRLTIEVYVGGGFISPDSPYIATLSDVAGRAATTTLLVAELADEVVGAVAYCPPGSPYGDLAEPGEAEFRMLAVRSQARGNGAGAALVQACLDRAREAGCATLRLSTQQNMRAAHRMYERFGFIRTPDRDWAPRPGIDLLTYAYVL